MYLFVCILCSVDSHNFHYIGRVKLENWSIDEGDEKYQDTFPRAGSACHTCKRSQVVITAERKPCHPCKQPFISHLTTAHFSSHAAAAAVCESHFHKHCFYISSSSGVFLLFFSMQFMGSTTHFPRKNVIGSKTVTLGPRVLGSVSEFHSWKKTCFLVSWIFFLSIILICLHSHSLSC